MNKGRATGPMKATYRVIDVIDDGKHRLRLKSVSVGARKEFDSEAGTKNDCYVWDFQTGDGANTLSYKTGLVYGNRSASLTGLLEAFHGGRRLTEDELRDLDMRELIGQYIDAVIITETDDDGNKYNKFAAVFAVKDTEPKK